MIKLLKGDLGFLFEIALVHPNGKRVREEREVARPDDRWWVKQFVMKMVEIDTILIQSDWDYPATARTFGWDIRSVQKASKRRGFDFKADCGISVCDDCGYPLYPMEFEEHECPECGGHCTPYIPCDHVGTDGTVPCACGLTQTDFISAAHDWLTENTGAIVEDPGYFDGG